MTDRVLPKLEFNPGNSSGFTPAGISGFSDLRPSAIIRELIQNSLDAAIQAKVEPAIILFRLSSCKKEEVPGIREYEIAFENAVNTQKDEGGELNSQARGVVQVIQSALDKSEYDILSVLDNGIGLDQSRMNALLSDGVSVKGSGATGTYGNGHSTVIPASDLRYVLYGGIVSSGARIGGGHTVLASSKRSGERQPISGDGYLHVEMKDGNHICASGSKIPCLIAREIDWIEENMNHGTAVIVPAFNHFRDEEELGDLIFQSAANSFFPAIEDGRLIVQFENNLSDTKSPGPKTLDRTMLKEILKKREESRNRARGDFISGSRAYSAYTTLRAGEENEISTEIGKIKIYHRTLDSGKTWIDLCRNGMWITDEVSLPVVKRHVFSNVEPFHAILMLDSSMGKEPLYELVRSAEGPLHNTLDVKRLPKEDVKKLRRAFGEIKEWLQHKIPKINSETYAPDDYLTLDFGELGEMGQNLPSYRGTPEAVKRRGPSPSKRETDSDTNQMPAGSLDDKPGSKNKPSPKPLSQQAFSATSVAIGPSCRRIIVKCMDSVSNAQFRLCIDENIDATCNRHPKNDNEPLALKEGIQINGELVNPEKLVKKNGAVTGVHLGDTQLGNSLDIVVEYVLPDNLKLPLDYEPTLRIDILKGDNSYDVKN